MRWQAGRVGGQSRGGAPMREMPEIYTGLLVPNVPGVLFDDLEIISRGDCHQGQWETRAAIRSDRNCQRYSLLSRFEDMTSECERQRGKLTEGWVETGKIRPDASASPLERVTRTSYPSTKVDRLFSYVSVQDLRLPQNGACGCPLMTKTQRHR